MTDDRWLVRNPDGSWALVVRPLPALAGLAFLVAGLGLWLVSRMGRVWTFSPNDALLALAVVGVATVVALARTTAFTALVAAFLVTLVCWGLEFNHGYGYISGLPWTPYVIASAGLVTLAGSLGMLAGFRAVGRNASAAVQRSLTRIATPTPAGRTLLAVGLGGITMVLAGAGVRHALDSRRPVPVEVVVGLAVVLVVVWLLLFTRWRATSYLIPLMWAVAGLVALPFAVVRLWSHWPCTSCLYDSSQVSVAAPTLFDPESGGLGVVAGCLLMVIGAVALLALRVRRADRVAAGSWALLVRPLPALTCLAAVVAGLGLWTIMRTNQAQRPDEVGVILAVVGVATAVAVAWTRALPALVAAVITVLACPVNESTRGSGCGYGWDGNLPWSPFGIAWAGLMVLAASLCMLVGFRAVGSNASTRIQRSLAEITTGTLLGRTLLAVGFGGIAVVLTAAGIRHVNNSVYPLPSGAVVLLAVFPLVVLLLLDTGWRATSYLIPVMWAVAGLAVAPYAVGRLWTYYPAYHDGLWLSWPPTPDQPEHWVFDPESGSFAAAAGCLLMVTGAVALLVLRVRRAVGTR